MVSAEMQPTDSQKYERVHNDGRRERSSANSSRSMREEYPLNCWTIKCGEYVGLDFTKIWIWSCIVSISTISTSISSAFLRMSSFKRNSIFGDITFLAYHSIRKRNIKTSVFGTPMGRNIPTMCQVISLFHSLL